jgi:hypothetical protein
MRSSKAPSHFEAVFLNSQNDGRVGLSDIPHWEIAQSPRIRLTLGSMSLATTCACLPSRSRTTLTLAKASFRGGPYTICQLLPMTITTCCPRSVQLHFLRLVRTSLPRPYPCMGGPPENQEPYSPPTCAPFSATDRRMSRTEDVKSKPTAAETEKTSKYASDEAC